MVRDDGAAMLHLDPADAHHAYALRRLGSAEIAWLTTVDATGSPQPLPVWFLWDGADRVTIYSQAGTHKLTNIARSPRVTFHFDSEERGEAIVVFAAEARVVPDAPSALASPAYLAKYRELIPMIGMTPESFAAEFHVVLELRLLRMRGMYAPQS
jgi:PPOX class probable F420-dependent enzyme